jgi:mitochondrial fission process protein 1
MFWGKGPDKPQAPKESPAETVKDTAQEVKTAAKDVQKAAKDFDPDKLPERHKLPTSLQNIVDKADKEENFYNELVEG